MKTVQIIAVALLLAGPGAASEWRSPLAECRQSGLPGRCGVLQVPENPASPGGRQLEIRVFVMPATDADSRVSDALLVLEGGPGASVLATAPMHASTFGRVRRVRDLVFVEQRGTGESAALDCGLGTSALLDPERVRECRQKLERGADLRFYGTSAAVADLRLALDALGYERVNVFGVSYGTRTALELVRRHPDRVRTVSLLGTYPPGRNAVLDAPWILDRSLELIAGACASDDVCDGAYPQLASALEQLERRLDGGELDLPRLELASTLRLMLFYPLTTRQVPAAIAAGAAGDVGPMQAIGSQVGAAFGGITDGAFLSLLCSEDVARLSDDAVENAGRGTLLGGTWGQALMRACGEWTMAEVPSDFHSALDRSPPLLSLTGELDPSMPPSYGEELADGLDEARHLTLPEAQHGLLGMGGVICVVELLEALIDSGSAATVDAACLSQLKRPPFAVQ